MLGVATREGSMSVIYKVCKEHGLILIGDKWYFNPVVVDDLQEHFEITLIEGCPFAAMRPVEIDYEQAAGCL